MALTPYYQDDACTIYHGDCREILPHLEPVDLVVSDPPFGINHASSFGASWENTVIANDESTDARDWVVSYFHDTPMLLFGTWKAQRPAATRQVLIFDKGPAFGMGDLSFPWKNSFEEIYVIGNGFKADRRDEGVIKGHFTAFSEAAGRVHPNEKPVSLLQYLISRHPGNTILDPFMGSGTTLRAAKDLGRKAIGIEIEEKYCEIAVKRLAQEVLPL
jgi:DNA modification methylase